MFFKEANLSVAWFPTAHATTNNNNPNQRRKCERKGKQPVCKWYHSCKIPKFPFLKKKLIYFNRETNSLPRHCKAISVIFNVDA